MADDSDLDLDTDEFDDDEPEEQPLPGPSFWKRRAHTVFSYADPKGCMATGGRSVTPRYTTYRTNR